MPLLTMHYSHFEFVLNRFNDNEAVFVSEEEEEEEEEAGRSSDERAPTANFIY